MILGYAEAPATVRHEIVVFSGKVYRAAVGQMSAGCQAHAQHGVSGLQKRHVYGCIGLGTAVRLNVGMLRAEKFLGTLNGNFLHHVHALASAIVARMGISLCVLVGQNRSRRQQNGLGHHVFRCDQFNAIAFPIVFPHDCVRNFRIV